MRLPRKPSQDSAAYTLYLKTYVTLRRR